MLIDLWSLLIELSACNFELIALMWHKFCNLYGVKTCKFKLLFYIHSNRLITQPGR